MMGRFCRYVEKVFRLTGLLEELRDGRQKPQVPVVTVLVSVLMMCVLRLKSLHALEGELRMPGRWEKLVGRRKPSADTVARVVAQIDTEQLRRLLWDINHRLRRNKALPWSTCALRFVALDGHEFFSQ